MDDFPGEYLNAPKVTRVEIIDADGRAFVGYYEPGAFVSFQDARRTMKVFLGDRSES